MTKTDLKSTLKAFCKGCNQFLQTAHTALRVHDTEAALEINHKDLTNHIVLLQDAYGLDLILDETSKRLMLRSCVRIALDDVCSGTLIFDRDLDKFTFDRGSDETGLDKQDLSDMSSDVDSTEFEKMTLTQQVLELWPPGQDINDYKYEPLAVRLEQKKLARYNMPSKPKTSRQFPAPARPQPVQEDAFSEENHLHPSILSQPKYVHFQTTGPSLERTLSPAHETSASQTEAQDRPGILMASQVVTGHHGDRRSSERAKKRRKSGF